MREIIEGAFRWLDIDLVAIPWETLKALGAWLGIGLIVGLLSRLVFYPGRSMVGSFGELVKTAILGCAGAGLAILAGWLFGIPQAGEFGLVLILLAVPGALLILWLASRFGR